MLCGDMTKITPRDQLVAAYIGSLDIRSVVIFAGPGGEPGQIGGNPAPNLAPFDTLWFAKSQHAELVLSRCPVGLVERTGAALRDEIINIAALLGASWKTGAEIEADASYAVAQIVENVERARIRGELRKMNADYKLYRQQQILLGKKPIGYGEHLTNFTRKLVVLAATSANALCSRQVESVSE